MAALLTCAAGSSHTLQEARCLPGGRHRASPGGYDTVTRWVLLAYRRSHFNHKRITRHPLIGFSEFHNLRSFAPPARTGRAGFLPRTGTGLEAEISERSREPAGRARRTRKPSKRRTEGLGLIRLRGASQNRMKLRSLASAIAIAGTILLCSGISRAVSANPPCPQLGWADGCNTIITLNSNGTSTINITSATTYDGIEDQLVGVINNSGSTIYSLTLSGTKIFGFDGDGAFSSACNAATGTPPFPCGAATPGDTTGYAGPSTSFTITDANNGVVNFAGGVPNGGTAFFSLEEAPSAGGFTVTGTGTTPTVPEPGSILFFATGILGIGALVWKRNALLANLS